MPTTRRLPVSDTTTPLPKLRKDLSAPGLLGAIRAQFATIADPRSGCTIPLVDALMSGLAVFSLKYPSLRHRVIEDSLASNGPHIERLEALDMRYILGVKPGDHARLFEQVHEAITAGRCHEVEVVDSPNREHDYRWVNDLALNVSHPKRLVNFLEYWEIVDGKERIWSRITALPLDVETVETVRRAGRARWKVENETFNTLKNQGYRLEHNDGHGRQHLSTVFAQLMMLAFLVDQLQEASCRLFQAARNRFHARIVLWQKLRALFTDFAIPDWRTLWAALIRGHDDLALSPAMTDTS